MSADLGALPTAWLNRLRVENAEPVDTGMSEASVFRVRAGGMQCYLKLARDAAAESLRGEIARTAWLATRGIRVPEIIDRFDAENSVAVLYAALPGAAADATELPPKEAVTCVARAMARLHAIEQATCPFDESVAVRLEHAQRQVEAGQVDPTQFADRNRGVTPQAILARLQRAIPREDIVVVHGDATLSNMILDVSGGVGFVDCGNVGRADRYRDLAVLAEGIEDAFGPRFVRLFTSTYGEKRWDKSKAAFYSDLYELF